VSFKSARVWPAVVAGVILAGAAAGCSSSGGTSGGTPVSTTMPVVTGLETKNIVVSDFPAIDSAGLFIAASEGLFAKEGLNVKVVPDFKSSQDTVNNIESGKFQVSSGDYVTYMNDEVSGSTPQLEIIGEGSVLQPNVLALMAGPGNKVTKLSQIKGTAVPISGPNDIGSLLIDAASPSTRSITCRTSSFRRCRRWSPRARSRWDRCPNPSSARASSSLATRCWRTWTRAP
jgi:ABC-type nitrate/sulfonate/bicarbonate transport system substrate-binding protein